MKDKKLVEMIINKSEEGFNEVYEKYCHLVYYVVFKIIGNREDSLDVTNDTFVKMYDHIGQYKGGNFKYWLLQIAKNEAINFATRVKNKRDKVLLDNEKIDKLPNSDYSFGKYDDLLRRNFTIEEQSIIIYKVIFNFTFDEIASELHKNKSYVYRSYKDILRKLRKLMEEK